MGVRGIRKIGQVSITVEDTAKAVSFYRDALGLSYIWETNGMAFFPAIRKGIGWRFNRRYL